MIHIGIDPGKNGGIAWFDPDGIAQALKMPATESDLWDIFMNRFCPYFGYQIAIIERVHAMPKQGVTSTFVFGRGYGSLLMALTAAAIPFEEVTPRTWMTALGCLTKGDKTVTKRKAQQLFPHLKVTHSIADALLIAEYCRRTRGER